MYELYYIPYTIPPRIPHPHSGGGSKDVSKQANTVAQQDGMWKDHGSVKDSDTTSLENIGNEKMPSSLNNLGAWGQGTTLDQAEWHAARIGEVNDHASGSWGSAYVTGATDFLKFQGRVFGDTGYKDGTVMASGGVQGRFELVGQHYQAGYTSPTLFNFGGHDISSQTTVNADAYVGATGTIQGGIALGKNDYVQVGASGFAGASATVQGSEKLGDVASVNGSASGYVGVGAKGDVDLGYKDGELSFNFGLGVAWGIGYSLDFGFSINVGAIADGVYNEAGDACKAVGNACEDAGKAVGNAVEGAADDVKDAICDVFDW